MIFQRRTNALWLIPCLFLLAACGTPAPTASPATSAVPSGGGQWDQVVAAAKQEGALVVYGQAGSDVAEALTASFKSRYPDVKLDFTGGNGNELVTKVITERQAGRFGTDVMIQGPPNLLDLAAANALDPIPPLLTGPDEDASK